MRRQRNKAQIKEQNKAPEKELNKTEISNLSDAEFKTPVIKMFKEFTGHCNSIKKTQAKMKVALSEIKKNLQGTNNGGDEAEIQTNELECKELSIQPEQQKEKRILKNEYSIRSLWDISKHTNIRIIGMSEGEEERTIENLVEKK